MEAKLGSLLNAHLSKKIQLEKGALSNVQNDRPKFPPPEKKVVTSEIVNSNDKDSTPAPAPNAQKVFISTHKSDDLDDYIDSEPIINDKVKILADLIQSSSNCVIFTGAGISTSAKIPDYRSKTGVWTLLEQGKPVQSEIQIDQAQPTIAHNCIADLIQQNKIKFVVSTNIDGLHRKSGVPADKIAEIHGNCYLETCCKCKKQYLRAFNCTVRNSGRIEDISDASDTDHRTGRVCDDEECRGELKDSIVKFGENLHVVDYQKASAIGEDMDLAIVIGSSMRVSPACNLPRRVIRNNQKGKMVIVNKQKTKFEDEMWLHIYGDIDEVMTKLDNILKSQ